MTSCFCWVQFFSTITEDIFLEFSLWTFSWIFSSQLLPFPHGKLAFSLFLTFTQIHNWNAYWMLTCVAVTPIHCMITATSHRHHSMLYFQMSFDFMTNPSPPAPWGLPPTPGWDSSTSCVPLSESTPLHAPDSPLVDNSVTSDLYSIPPTPSSLHSFVAGSPPDSLPDQDSAPFQEILVEPPALGRGHSVKDELRSRIRKRRQDSGLMEITIREEDKKPPERLSKETKVSAALCRCVSKSLISQCLLQISQMDVVRRQKRRESNRRAAAKSRVKKKAEADTLSSVSKIINACMSAFWALFWGKKYFYFLRNWCGLNQKMLTSKVRFIRLRWTSRSWTQSSKNIWKCVLLINLHHHAVRKLFILWWTAPYLNK